MKFLKVLAINCVICLAIMSVAWVSSGTLIGIACTHSLIVAELFRLSSEEKFFLDNRDIIGFATDDMKIILVMFLPYALVVTLSLNGKIAFTQTLSKSQRGRDFIERIKSLDEYFGRVLRKLAGDRTDTL